jgi:hypothetical protein
MRAAGSSARRRLVFVLVGGAHTCLVLILAHRPLIEPRGPQVDDISMAMIFFAPARRPAIEGPPPMRKPVVRRPTLPQPAAIGIPAVPPPPSPENSGHAIDWDLERARAAQSMIQPPPTRTFGAQPSSEVAAPHPDPPVHHAGESYRDRFGDTIVWLSAKCYIVSEAQQLGTPETFKHLQPTRGGCIRQGPAEGEMFKDLPEYKKRHPQ